MGLQQPPYAAVLLLSAVASGFGAIFALRRRETRGAIPLAAVMAFAAVWTVGYTFQLASVGFEVKLFWWRVKYIGIAVVPTAWLVFALEYTGRDRWVTRRSVALLSIEPLLLVVVVWTNHLHHLYVRAPTVDSTGAIAMLVTPIAPGFWFFVGYHYLLLVVGTALLVRIFLVADHLYRSQAIAILLGVFAPWTANALFLLDATPAGIDFTPMAFAVTGIALTWALFRHELLEIVPVTRELARQELLDSITDATIVVDENYHVVDLNPPARLLVPDDVSEPLGEPVGRVLPELSDLFDDDPEEERIEREVEFTRNRHDRHYDVRVSPLTRGYGVLRGHIVIMRDITDRERHRQRLEVMNRVLRHDIRNDINLIMGYADDVLDGNGAAEDRAVDIKETAFEIAELSEQARMLERTLGDDVVLERIDLIALVRDRLEEVREEYPNVDVEAALPTGSYVYANPLIDSAIEELIQNAIEHNDHPSPVVRVAVDADGTDEFVELRVSDNGPGIPAEERDVIKRGTETQIQHSSGLGLWLVDWIVTESGGEIEFAENEPRGMQIAISLLDAGTIDERSGLSPGGVAT